MRRTASGSWPPGLAYAAGHTAGQLDRHLKRLLAAVDPGAVLTRRRRALAERGVWIDHRGDGTADLTARLDSTHAEQVYAAIRALALATQRTDTAAAGTAAPTGAGGHGSGTAATLPWTVVIPGAGSPRRPGDARSTCGWPTPWST